MVISQQGWDEDASWCFMDRCINRGFLKTLKNTWNLSNKFCLLCVPLNAEWAFHLIDSSTKATGQSDLSMGKNQHKELLIGSRKRDGGQWLLLWDLLPKWSILEFCMKELSHSVFIQSDTEQSSAIVEPDWSCHSMQTVTAGVSQHLYQMCSESHKDNSAVYIRLWSCFFF